MQWVLYNLDSFLTLKKKERGDKSFLKSTQKSTLLNIISCMLVHEYLCSLSCEKRNIFICLHNMLLFSCVSLTDVVVSMCL